ncbi:MAG: carbamoyltransferase HypF [Lentisphaeria bacterium]
MNTAAAGKPRSAPRRPPAVAARRLTVTGTVQGVGFRPFIHRLAVRHGLAGSVRNTGTGVVIVVEGAPAALAAFAAGLKGEAPPLARLAAVQSRSLPAAGRHGFAILPSADRGARAALSPPDAAVCDACLRELADPADRRYRHPFISCTDCGPRFTMTADLPFDRERTAMGAFPLCPACRRDYEDPAGRRFHAQAVCCPDCGPRLQLLDARGGPPAGAAEPLAAAIAALAAGRIVAVKGLGGFHLAVNAADATAVAELRRRKGRGRKPFAVMARDLEAARQVVHLDPGEAELLSAPERPIVLLRRREPPRLPLAGDLAPGNRWLGILLPYTPLHRLLLDGPLPLLVLTSGNLAEEPIVHDDAEAVRRLGHIADLFLTHDRPILHRADDSIVKKLGARVQVWRRSRGYVPRALPLLPAGLPPGLAVGGLMKNMAALTRGRDLFPTQHLGDVDSRAGLDFFEEAVGHLQRFLGVEPEWVAHDLHPGYATTEWALARPAAWRRIGVQHHEAHIAAGQLEHGRLDRPVIGIALDGTGYGRDGTLWGGELFTGRPGAYRRAAHLAPIPLPGGELAIRHPWRAVLGLLHQAGLDWRRVGPPCLASRPAVVEEVAALLERGAPAPLSSGCGRWFDAVAALLGLCDQASYEGEPAVALEMAAVPAERLEPWPGGWSRADSAHPWIWQPHPWLAALLQDQRRGMPVPELAWRFHLTLEARLAEIAGILREETGIGTVVLGGGVFLNSWLATRLPAQLRERGFEVCLPCQLPPGDGGLSAGQAAVAAALFESGR